LWVREYSIRGMRDMRETEDGRRWILSAQMLDQMTADKA
jgi:hypothetical protein